jgi:uncharacterized RDD family membrane protein YckC
MASADYSVLTPERVSLEYGIAGIGSRGAAAIVDTLIQFVAIGAILLASAAVSLLSRVLAGLVLDLGGAAAMGALTAVLLAVTLLATSVVALGYFMFFEIIWSGQTPGKRVLGIRVLRESGYPIRPVDAVIRNIVRTVDWLPFFYGTGALVMLLNGRSRRLGDFACGTIVVREGSRVLWPGPSGAVAAEPRGYSLSISGADATLVRDFLLRRSGMHPQARADLAKRLANALSQRYHLPLESDSDAEPFLERLAG